MRRRQILRIAQPRRPDPSGRQGEAPGPSQKEAAAPVALSYRSKAGHIVSIRVAQGEGIELWTGVRWVAAHVVPTRAK